MDSQKRGDILGLLPHGMKLVMAGKNAKRMDFSNFLIFMLNAQFLMLSLVAHLKSNLSFMGKHMKVLHFKNNYRRGTSPNETIFFL